MGDVPRPLESACISCARAFSNQLSCFPVRSPKRLPARFPEKRRKVLVVGIDLHRDEPLRAIFSADVR